MKIMRPRSLLSRALLTLLLLLLSSAQALTLFPLSKVGGCGPQQYASQTTSMALYPLPAVYLPGSKCMVRNIEPRNIAMCKEQSEFVAACVSADLNSVSSIGSILQIDDVRPAARDNSGQVLAAASTSNVLEVRCTVVGRVRLVACANTDAWRRPQRDEYLVAEVEVYEDEDRPEAEDSSIRDDVATELYRLVDVLLEGEGVDCMDAGMDVSASVASLERAAELAEDGEWWAALDVWQMHCATRLAGASAMHRAERNEFVISAKMQQGGVLSIPVQEGCASAHDAAPYNRPRIAKRDLPHFKHAIASR